MDLVSKILVQFQGTGTKTGAIQTGTSALKHTFSQALADGTSTLQADIVYAERKVIVAAADYDLDLHGVLEDIFGDAATFEKVKGLLVINRSESQTVPTDAIVAVGGIGATGWFGCFNANADKVLLPAPGVFAWSAPSAGIEVTAGTADILRFTNEDGADQAEIDIVLIGTSA